MHVQENHHTHEPAKTEEKRASGSSAVAPEHAIIQQVVEERLEKLNPTLSISYYPSPLKIKTAKGAIMIEENGQENLDCINNVSHIGHCHPKFVQRMA